MYNRHDVVRTNLHCVPLVPLRTRKMFDWDGTMALCHVHVSLQGCMWVDEILVSKSSRYNVMYMSIDVAGAATGVNIN